MIHEDLTRLFNHMNKDCDEWVRHHRQVCSKQVMKINTLNIMLENTNMDTIPVGPLTNVNS
jgi:hypothetical protein